jgi:hypothetical protein
MTRRGAEVRTDILEPDQAASEIQRWLGEKRGRGGEARNVHV